MINHETMEEVKNWLQEFKAEKPESVTNMVDIMIKGLTDEGINYNGLSQTIDKELKIIGTSYKASFKITPDNEG